MYGARRDYSEDTMRKLFRKLRHNTKMELPEIDGQMQFKEVPLGHNWSVFTRDGIKVFHILDLSQIQCFIPI